MDKKQTTAKPPSPEWWDGHRTGFRKGLNEARWKAIDMAKGLPNTDAGVSLRLLAHTLYELAQQ